MTYTDKREKPIILIRTYTTETLSRYTATALSALVTLLSAALHFGWVPDATLRFVMFQAPMPGRDVQAVWLCIDVKYDDLLCGFRQGRGAGQPLSGRDFSSKVWKNVLVSRASRHGPITTKPEF